MNTLLSRLVFTNNALGWRKRIIANHFDPRDNGRMGPASSAPIPVLTYGHDKDLLETRRLLFVQAGFSAHTAINQVEFQKLVAEAKPSYTLFILCHTVPKAEWPTLRQIAASANAVIYQLACAISPANFLKEVNQALPT